MQSTMAFGTSSRCDRREVMVFARNAGVLVFKLRGTTSLRIGLT